MRFFWTILFSLFLISWHVVAGSLNEGPSKYLPISEVAMLTSSECILPLERSCEIASCKRTEPRIASYSPSPFWTLIPNSTFRDRQHVCVWGSDYYMSSCDTGSMEGYESVCLQVRWLGDRYHLLLIRNVLLAVSIWHADFFPSEDIAVVVFSQFKQQKLSQFILEIAVPRKFLIILPKLLIRSCDCVLSLLINLCSLCCWGSPHPSLHPFLLME